MQQLQNANAASQTFQLLYTAIQTAEIFWSQLLCVKLLNGAICSTARAVSDHRQRWWTWGLSGVSSILGYVPSKEHPQALPLRPSQAEMQELFATLSLDPNNLPDGRDPSRKLAVIGDVKVGLPLTCMCKKHNGVKCCHSVCIAYSALLPQAIVVFAINAAHMPDRHHACMHAGLSVCYWP